jgi:hypothetical protein
MGEVMGRKRPHKGMKHEGGEIGPDGPGFNGGKAEFALSQKKKGRPVAGPPFPISMLVIPATL